jgi:hypothetical protein
VRRSLRVNKFLENTLVEGVIVLLPTSFRFRNWTTTQRELREWQANFFLFLYFLKCRLRKTLFTMQKNSTNTYQELEHLAKPSIFRNLHLFFLKKNNGTCSNQMPLTHSPPHFPYPQFLSLLPPPINHNHNHRLSRNGVKRNPKKIILCQDGHHLLGQICLSLKWSKSNDRKNYTDAKPYLLLAGFLQPCIDGKRNKFRIIFHHILNLDGISILEFLIFLHVHTNL